MIDHSGDAANSHSSIRFGFLASVGIVSGAALLRIFGALNDLWIDEIWSIEFAQRVKRPWEILTSIHHDNNHYLNTLSLFLIGSHGNWPGYRIPAIVFGVLAIVTAGAIGRRRSPACAIIAMLLTGVSYVLVHYSSEARGYSGVVFFCYLSYYLMDIYLEKPTISGALYFSLAAILGFASHLIYLNCYLALLAWSAWRLVRTRVGVKRFAVSMLTCHAFPTAFVGLLYLIDIRYMVIGGGNPASLFESYADSLQLALGWFQSGAVRWVECILAAAVFIAGLGLLFREKSDAWVFFLCATLVFPIGVAVVRGSQLIYPRYFMVGTCFLLLLLAYELAAIYERVSYGKTICAAFLTGFFVLNGGNIAALYKDGRGHFSEALRYIATHSKDDVITIAGDHDFRVGFVLEFHAREALWGKEWKYYTLGSWPRQGPEWVICHAVSAEALTDSAGNKYTLEQSYKSGPLSGLNWRLYRNVSR